MIVNIRNDRYVVSWEYGCNLGKNGRQPKHVTNCLIYKDNGTKPIQVDKNRVAVGTTICHPIKDHFSKDQGRKISMSRALESMILTKEDRQEFWNVYFETIRNVA